MEHKKQNFVLTVHNLSCRLSLWGWGGGTGSGSFLQNRYLANRLTIITVTYSTCAVAKGKPESRQA